MKDEVLISNNDNENNKENENNKKEGNEGDPSKRSKDIIYNDNINSEISNKNSPLINNDKIKENTEIKANESYSNAINEKNKSDNLKNNNEGNSNEVVQKTNNNKNKLKSSLKGSKTKIKLIKNKIMDLFDDKSISDKLEKFESNNNPFNILDDFTKYQESYENKIEEIFNDKMKKMDEIDEKYSTELNELMSYMEEEKEEEGKEEDENVKKEEKVPSAIQIMYDSILEDKNNEIKKIKNEYEENRNKIKNQYKENIESDDVMKNDFYYKELFEEIKNGILSIINPLNSKKVTFLEEENKAEENNK